MFDIRDNNGVNGLPDHNAFFIKGDKDAISLLEASAFACGMPPTWNKLDNIYGDIRNDKWTLEKKGCL